MLQLNFTTKNFNMKKIILLLVLSFFLGKLIAQDTIVKRNSDLIIAKILEISPTEIRYKKFEFQDGPTYIEIKSTVQMIRYSNGMKETFGEVKKEKEEVQAEKTTVKVVDDVDYYSKPNSVTGTSKIEVFGSKYRTNGKRINEKAMRTMLLETKDPKIATLVDQSKRAQRRQFIWIAAIPLGQIAAVAALSARPYDPITQTYGARNNGMVALSTVCVVGAIACPIVAINQKHKKKSTTAAAIKLYNQKF